MTNRTPQTEDKYVVRFPDGLRDRIKAAAAENNRSMNAEIIATLQSEYPEPEQEEEVLLTREQTGLFVRLMTDRDTSWQTTEKNQERLQDIFEMIQEGKRVKFHPDGPLFDLDVVNSPKTD